MTWQVGLTPTADRERRRLDAPQRSRIDALLVSLISDPRPVGARKLVGTRHDWRVRSGDYRILYEIDEEHQSVTVWRIAHRREAYR